MAKSKTPDRSKMTSEELRKFELLFSEVDSDLRMQFTSAVCTIQTAVYMIKKKEIISQKIHKWFINEYIQEYLKLDLNINFDYENIAKTFLKSKFLIDLDFWKPLLLEALNEVQRQAKEQIFLTWDKYCEYMINNGYTNKQSQKLYDWITCKDKKWYKK